MLLVEREVCLFEGIQYLASRAVRRHVTGPGRLRHFESRTRPFIYRSPYGLTFELVPGEFIDRNIILDGLYEDRYLALLAKLLTAESVVLDIGANIGNHALFLARHCSEVHCYEPNPRVLRRLERNIELNGAENIIVHGFGLGEENETATFHENVDGNVGASSFVKPFGDCRAVQLPIRNAAEAVAELQLQRLDLVKVDVEGMEELVFRALRPTIERFKPAIAFEFRGQLEDLRGFDTIRTLLSGYQIYEAQFSPAEGSLFSRIAWNLKNAGMPDLVPVERVEPRAYENLVALPA